MIFLPQEQIHRLTEERNAVQAALAAVEAREPALKDELASLRDELYDARQARRQQQEGVLGEARTRAVQAEAQLHEAQLELQTLSSTIAHYYREAVPADAKPATEPSTSEQLRLLGRELARRQVALHAAQQQLAAENVSVWLEEEGWKRDLIRLLLSHRSSPRCPCFFTPGKHCHVEQHDWQS